MMAMERPMTPGEGEQLESARRRRFWRILGWLAGAGFVVGLVVGITYALLEDGQLAATAISPALIIGAVAIALAAFLYGTWRFFVSIDELEMQDNLWSSMVGFYVYSTLFPLWWLLWRAGVTIEPNDWVIFTITLVSGTLVYFYRKWRAR